MAQAAPSHTSRSAEEIARMRDMAAYLSDLANTIPEQAEMLWRMAQRIEEELQKVKASSELP